MLPAAIKNREESKDGGVGAEEDPIARGRKVNKKNETAIFGGKVAKESRHEERTWPERMLCMRRAARKPGEELLSAKANSDPLASSQGRG